MRLLILSDLHITENGNPIWDTDTLSHFQKAIRRINMLNNIDAIIVSGDIADAGSLWVYNFVYEQLSILGYPTYYIPGNHDSVANMRSIIDKEHFLTPFYVKDWKFIPLNSVMPDDTLPGKNMGRGYLAESDIFKLIHELDTDRNICLILHHPPIAQDGWLNRKLLENMSTFNEIISQHPNVKLVLYGHTHYHSVKHMGHTTYICAPSIGFAFDKDLPKFQIASGEEALLLIEANDMEIVCKQIHIG